MFGKNKVAAKNFEYKDLPQNRKEQFFDLFKNHFRTLLWMALVTFIFMIPLIAVMVYKDWTVIAITARYQEKLITIEEANIQIGSVNRLAAGIYIPCFMLVFLGFAGPIRVLRQLIWSEPVFLKYDYFKGLKQNYGPYLLSGFLFGLFNFVQELIRYTAGTNQILIAIPLGIEWLLIFPIIFVYLFVSTMYSSVHGSNFKVSAYLFFRHLPTTLLLSLLTFGLYFLRFIQNPLIKYLVLLAVLLIYLPTIVLIGYLNEIRILDLRINEKDHPELMNKGLFLITAETSNELDEKKEKAND